MGNGRGNVGGDMLLRDAIEKWGREHREVLGSDDRMILRVMWSVLRNSEFGEQDVSTIGAEDRDQILKLFSIPKRDAVADVLHSVFLWATGSADTTHSTRGIDAKPDSSSSSVAPKQRFEERELAAAEQITAPAEDEPVVELEMQGASSLGFDTDDAAPDVAPCLDALRSTTDTRSGKRKKPNPLAMHAAMVARGHVDDRSGKGGEVLSDAIDVPGAAVGAAATDVSEDVVADDVAVADEPADVVAVAGELAGDVVDVDMADEPADVVAVADDVMDVDADPRFDRRTGVVPADKDLSRSKRARSKLRWRRARRASEQAKKHQHDTSPVVTRGHVDDGSGKGGEVLSEAIDVPGAAVGAAAADVSEDVVADDVVDMADVAVAADLADDATILDELADVLAVARSDVLAVARGLADELADVLVVADDVVAVDVVAVDVVAVDVVAVDLADDIADVVAVDLADDIADVELTEDVVVERQSATEPASGADETSTEENTPSPRPGLVKRAPTAERWIDPRFDRRTGAACTDKAASRRKRAASKLRGRRARRASKHAKKHQSDTSSNQVFVAVQAKSKRQPAIVFAVFTVTVAVAAVFAGLALGSPTGLTAWDTAMKAILAVMFVAATGKAPNWVAVATATVAVALIGGSVWLAPAAAGLVIAVAAGFLSETNRWLQPGLVRAVAAGLAIQGLLRLPPVGFFGLPTLIAGASVLLALVMGYQHTQGRARRVTRISVAVLASALVVVLAAGGFAMWGVRSDAERGIAAAREGLAAARDGDPETVVAQLETAAEALDAAEDRASSLLTQPLRLIPVVAQHHHAITTATRNGSVIARQASRAITSADISTISMVAGSVDLSALTAMEPDLTKTAALLETGVDELDEARSPWLLSPVSTRMASLTDEMRDVLPEAQIAAHAARVVPGLLGEDGPRRYFVAFGSPAESRELGGFIGSWALLEFDNGKVNQIDADRVRALYDLTRANAKLSTTDYPLWYISRAKPQIWPQNMTSSPQLLTVAEASRDLFDGLGGGPIDGFVYLDGYVLAALLKLTGPITIDELDTKLAAGNAVDFFFDGQYRVAERDEAKSELNGIFRSVFASLTDSQLPGPERLGRELGPVARAGRLQVATFDDDENAFLREIKLQRSFVLSPATPDSFAVIQASGSASKLDTYLYRDVTYDVAVDDDGQLAGSVVVDLSSQIPDDAPAYALGTNSPGVNTTFLSLYTPHELVGVQIDGEDVEHLMVQEFGYQRYEVEVELDANTSRSIVYRLEGRVASDQEYAVSIWHQPLVNNDNMNVKIRTADGSESATSFELVENIVIAPLK